MNDHNSGYTLIEIAMVLAIIGLLLGGIVKGQELINNTKVKNLAADFTNIPISIYGYQDKFHSYPGDDAAATIHLTAPTGIIIQPGNGNGTINGNWNDTITQNSESFNFWQQLRLGGFYQGPIDTTDPRYIPTNAVGGKIGVTNVLAKGQRNWQLRNKLTWFVGCVHNRFPLSYDYRTALDDYTHLLLYTFTYISTKRNILSISIGRKIRNIREALNMGRQEFADITGINKGTLIRIEVSEGEPRAGILVAIAQAWPEYAAYLLTDNVEIKQRRPEVAEPEKKVQRSTKVK